jgi:hypothetical protein
MAEVAALEIQIGANVDKAVAGMQQFDKSLLQLQDQLKTFKAAQETTFDPKQFVSYQQQINSLSQQIKNRYAVMDQAMLKTGEATKALTKTNSSATNSLFALSGIVQDAPFGFRAIANNITFFAQEMAYTTKTAGGFKAALSGMLGALSGPAGIIIGISAITSLLTVFFGNSKKAKNATDDLTVSVHNLADALGEGDKNAQKDLTHLQLLYTAATNVNKPMAERLAAVKALQKEYPTYLGNQSKENILAGQAAAAYERLKDQILATARARAAEDELVKNSQQQLQIEAKLTDLLKQRTVIQQKQDALAKNSQAVSGLNALSSTGDIAAGSLVNLGHQMSTLDDQIKDLVNQYGKLSVANKSLADSVNVKDLVAKPVGGVTSKTKTTTDKGNIRQAAYDVNNTLQNARNSYRAFTQAASSNIGDVVSSQFEKIGTAIHPVEELLTNAQIKFEQFRTRLKEGLQEAAADIRQSAIDAISGITQGFATGGFAGAAQALLSALGDIAIQLGNIAIGVGIGIQGIQLALESLNPIAAIAAGVALVALGAIAKSAASSLKLANGGVAYGPTSALIGEYPGASSNPEVVAPLSKLKALLGGGEAKQVQVALSGEFRISGNDLVAKINDTNKRNGRVN